MKKDSIIKNAFILFLITVITGGLLGFTYNATQEARDKQAALKTDIALNAVVSDSFFVEESVSGDYKFVKKVYKGTTEQDGKGDINGYAFQLETTEGYGDLIKLMVGFTVDGKISGIDIISHTETPGLGAKADDDFFKLQFNGKDVMPLTVVKGQSTEVDQVDAIGGATITSQAVTNAVNEAVDYYNTHLRKEAN